jgi:hypothetical protein
MSPITAKSLETTRRSLHGVAELVLAGPQHRRSRTIQLQVDPGGFRTISQPDLRVDGVDLIANGRRIPIDGRTCAELADAAGVEVGGLEGVYHDGSGVDADETLRLDVAAARWLADCWASGNAAMRRLAPDQRPILWPEHFDVGILAGGIGYGVSPGDTFLAEPYAYVTPPAARAGDFWNAPFGAARAMRDLDGANPDAVLAFFVDAGSRATADPAA